MIAHQNDLGSLNTHTHIPDGWVLPLEIVI